MRSAIFQLQKSWKIIWRLVKKSDTSVWKSFVLGIIAGLMIGFGGVVSNTAGHAINNLAESRVVCRLLFPFGLGVVMLIGTELFTGNTMIFMSALARKALLWEC